MTIKAGNIRKGMYIDFKGSPHLVTDTSFMSPGKGSAVMRARFKNVTTGNTQEFTYKSQEDVEQLELQSTRMQFLYKDGEDVVFMQPDTYEQVSISKGLIGEKMGIMTPDVTVHVLFYDETALGVGFPPKVTLKVVEAQDSTAGNTQGQAMKDVQLETGLVIKVPIFIKQGESVIVDTETLGYVSRG